MSGTSGEADAVPPAKRAYSERTPEPDDLPKRIKLATEVLAN